MTRAIRLLGVLLAITGAVYAGASLYMLMQVPAMAETLAYVKAHAAPGSFAGGNIADWSAGARLNLGIYLSVGAAATVAGIGIATRRTWGRHVWSVTSLLIFGFYLYAGLTRELWWHYIDLATFAATSLLFVAAGRSDAQT